MRMLGAPGARRAMLDDTDRARIYALFVAGMTCRRIAAEVKSSETNVRKVIARAHMKPKKPSVLSHNAPTMPLMP